MGLEKEANKLFLGIKERKYRDCSQRNLVGNAEPFNSEYGYYGKNLKNDKTVAYRDIREMALNVAKHLGRNYKEKISFSPPPEGFYELSQKNKSDLHILVKDFLKTRDFDFAHRNFPVYNLR